MRKIRTKSRKILADTYTPVSIYLKIRDVFPKSILLESTDFHHLENCYSFICVLPFANFTVDNDKLICKIRNETFTKEIEDNINIVNELQNFIESFQLDNNSYAFNGFYGYSSYNAVKYFETVKLSDKRDHNSIPELNYSLYKYIIAFNHYKDEIILLENLMEREVSDLDKLENILRNRNISNFPFSSIGSENTNFTNEEFTGIVKKAKENCLRGNVFQLVLSRKFSQEYQGDDFNVYRQLRSLNPSPYLFYFDYGSFRIFGSSPESQIEIKGNKAYINPIAGTYPRSGNDERDKELAITLSEDSKENAEHVMLVDLARNDLSRNADNIKVENYKEIHFYSHVIHIVSKVSGEISDKNPVKMLADTFPAGTLTGAPKYRAMQLINEYEPAERGFYGGCIGFIGFNGELNKAITIRTFLSKNNTLFYQAGAGIVSKSDETKELLEVNHKLTALKQAIKNANTHKNLNKNIYHSLPTNN
ncbi:MAG: anthranilate synthase component I [Marinilabiliales bacterium]|nr:MAG: anthranilate synthase component I [Marinilabiliales bacterium]